MKELQDQIQKEQQKTEDHLKKVKDLQVEKTHQLKDNQISTKKSTHQTKVGEIDAQAIQRIQKQRDDLQIQTMNDNNTIGFFQERNKELTKI